MILLNIVPAAVAELAVVEKVGRIASQEAAVLLSRGGK
jgi:hypothetical protein